TAGSAAVQVDFNFRARAIATRLQLDLGLAGAGRTSWTRRIRGGCRFTANFAGYLAAFAALFACLGSAFFAPHVAGAFTAFTPLFAGALSAFDPGGTAGDHVQTCIPFQSGAGDLCQLLAGFLVFGRHAFGELLEV